MKILVVDDERLARQRLARMVKQLDSCTLLGEAKNGLEAVQNAEQLKPDVVLMDIRMPGMDGLEAARHMVEMEKPPAIIFCTAFEEYAVDAFDVLAMGYLLQTGTQGTSEQRPE